MISNRSWVGHRPSWGAATSLGALFTQIGLGAGL